MAFFNVLCRLDHGSSVKFCAFENANNYADGQPNLKFCANRYHSKGWYDRYDVANVADEFHSESRQNYHGKEIISDPSLADNLR